MPPRFDRALPTFDGVRPQFDSQPKTPDTVRELVRRVLTNTDGFSDEGLIAALHNIRQKQNVTQAEIVQMIKEFPREQVSSSGKSWFLDMVNRVFVTEDKTQAPMKT